MGFKSNLAANLSDARSRVLLILMIAIITIVLFFAYFSLRKAGDDSNSQNGVTSSAQILNPGSTLNPIPGSSKTTKTYSELSEKKYKEEVGKAISASSKGIPTATLPSLSAGNNNSASIASLLGKGDGSDGDSALLNNNGNDDSLQSQQNRQKQLEDDLQRQYANQATQRQLEEYNKKVQSLMNGQSQVLAQNWQVTPQTYVSGIPKSYPKTKRMLTELDDPKNKDTKPKIFYKAGDILFGVMLTSVNSDEPGPVLARVVSGPLGGSKIIGGINPATIPQKGTDARVSKTLILEFNVLNIPGMKSSIPVKAVAINPDTARTSLATSVDNHYLLRYGTFFASNFLAGLGSAIAMQNQTKVVTGNGSIDIGTTAKKSSKDEALQALGKVGEEFGKQLNFIDMPPTIKIASGTAIGLLLQTDIVIKGDDTGKLISKNLSKDFNFDNLYGPEQSRSSFNTEQNQNANPAYGVPGNESFVVLN